MTVSVQTGLNWFLLSLQTAKPSDKKIYCRYHHQDFWTEYFFFLWYDDVYLAEGHTAVDISVKQSWKKLYLKILMRVTCLGFSNIEEFYRSCNFGCFWWIFKNIKPIQYIHTKIFVWPSQIFYVFSLIFPHPEKVV